MTNEIPQDHRTIPDEKFKELLEKILKEEEAILRSLANK
jgi:hypothetical protein